MSADLVVTHRLNTQIHDDPPVHLSQGEASSSGALGIANKIANNIKKISLSAAAVFISMPARFGIALAVCKSGLISETPISQIVNSSTFLNKAYAISECIGYVNISIFNEMRKLSGDFAKVDLLANGIFIPIFEEIVFRGLIQDVMLTRIPKYVVSKILPGRETILDSKMAKVARIIIAALLFSTVGHAYNCIYVADYVVKMQMVGALIAGLGLGMIKESNAGLLGSIGAHAFNNMIGVLKHYV